MRKRPKIPKMTKTQKSQTSSKCLNKTSPN